MPGSASRDGLAAQALASAAERRPTCSWLTSRPPGRSVLTSGGLKRPKRALKARLEDDDALVLEGHPVEVLLVRKGAPVYGRVALVEDHVADVVLLHDPPRALAFGVVQDPQRVPQRPRPEGRQVPSPPNAGRVVGLHSGVASHGEHPAAGNVSE